MVERTNHTLGEQVPVDVEIYLPRIYRARGFLDLTSGLLSSTFALISSTLGARGYFILLFFASAASKQRGEAKRLIFTPAIRQRASETRVHKLRMRKKKNKTFKIPRGAVCTFLRLKTLNISLLPFSNNGLGSVFWPQVVSFEVRFQFFGVVAVVLPWVSEAILARAIECLIFLLFCSARYASGKGCNCFDSAEPVTSLLIHVPARFCRNAASPLVDRPPADIGRQFGRLARSRAARKPLVPRVRWCQFTPQH